MRIAFDLDGVLADLHEPFVRTAVRLFPQLEAQAIGATDIGPSPEDEGTAESDAPIAPPPPSLAITRQQSDAIWRAVAAQENFWEDLTEIEPGVIARLAALADERMWEVLFITSRPKSAGRTVQRQSQRWLARMGFPLPSVFVVHGSRGHVAAALHLDVVVDDRPENCLDVVLESRAGSILVWRGGAETVSASARRLGIAVVPTVAACLDALVETDRAETGTTLLDRLRRLFGVRTRAAATFRR